MADIINEEGYVAVQSVSRIIVTFSAAALFLWVSPLFSETNSSHAVAMVRTTKTGKDAGQMKSVRTGSVQTNSIRTELVQDAKRYLGVPYVWGGNGPNGLDCSGLVCRVYKEVVGKELPRTTEAEFAAGIPVGPSSIRPGDLVFFNTEGYVSHVGMYIGHDEFIQAASAGPDTGVIISSFAEAYYRERYVGARRFLPASTTASATSTSSTLDSAEPVRAASVPPVANLAAAFSGNFVMSFGKMTLRVSDAEGNVQGTFVSSGNAGWLVGKIDRSKNVLHANWVIPETSTHYRTSGEIIFKIGADNRLVGSWRYDGQNTWHDTWIAVRNTP